MKPVVIYATKTNHSKKLAEAIGAALTVKAGNIADTPVLPDSDLLFVVGGIYGGKDMPELLDYVRKLDIPSLKRAALVTSCASGKQRQDGVRRLLEEKGVQVMDEFICRGGILFVAATHPNAADLKAAADFARKIASQQ